MVTRQRYTGPLTSVIAANTSYTLWTLSTGKKAIIHRVYFANRNGVNGFLRIGYTTLGAVFTQVFPDWLILTGIPDFAEFPIRGNAVDGFVADTTAVTGSLGNIIVQCSVGAAAPNDVQVQAEVEEF